MAGGGWEEEVEEEFEIPLHKQNCSALAESTILGCVKRAATTMQCASTTSAISDAEVFGVTFQTFSPNNLAVL